MEGTWIKQAQAREPEKVKLLVRPKHVDDKGVVRRVVAANEEAGSQESREEEREAGDEGDKESKTS